MMFTRRPGRFYRTVLSIAFLLAAGSIPASGGTRGDGRIIDYRTETNYLGATPGVTGGAVGAFTNPAAWATGDKGEFAFWWNDERSSGGSPDNWGFSSGKNIGFAARRSMRPDGDGSFALYDYQLGFAAGDRRSHFGLAYRWAGGGTDRVPREKSLVAGMVMRPGKWASLGASEVFSLESGARLGVADVGLRPFGRPWVTLFADYSLRESESVNDGWWGAGVEVRPLRGIHFGVKFREADGGDDFGYSLNFGITLDDAGFHLLPSYDQDGRRDIDGGGPRPVTYLVRMSPPHGGLPFDHAMKKLFRKNRYVSLDLHDKRLTYRTARYFDERRIAWLDLAGRLDRIASDDAVRGVAINLAGFSTSPALAWEMRGALTALKEAGKEVIVHVESASPISYYIASAADRITVDPQGDLTLAGLAVYRTYMKGLLDKVGIGFDELRFMKYKSAMEGLTRTGMSDADKEQLGRLVNVIYEELRSAICSSRGLTEDRYDAVVEDKVILDAKEIVDAGFADDIARWPGLGDWLKENRDGALLERSAGGERPVFPDDRWGKPPEIAVVYALGVCSMDEGIRGRATSQALRKAAKRKDVAGVVLRADSPGGAVLPSDLVADGMHDVREAGRSMVVSQGGVAASGGYWISMQGEKILTTPLTITGSIGVIGGWVYDKGVGEKTGFRADGVKRGSHSDLFTGIRFPGLGVLPARPFDEKENTLVREAILGMYEDFKEKVAKARSLPMEKVQEIAQGRVWMGGDALEIGLCDRYGTLPDAIAEAKSLAGIGAGEEVRITEFPPRKTFLLPRLAPSLPGASLLAKAAARWFGGGSAGGDDQAADYPLDYLRSIARSKGKAMILLPPEMLPGGWYEKP